ncbi:hypothetical protein MJO29_002191 [Puccinia striiformis f. sp. tritici]|uniref:Kinesin-like protein n=1 Tax=Puccinia striiformis f. sp. tritici PST-78 TaxID=1165861 RepID=A0A0L0W305_9BASI|nr:hypothetical protein Pst134EB_003771 [Puccinia striiformis f. sp. tritici]KAI7966443.1 hypothetical protein MJO29_002191 [Puccinia striiformis f. sp. tritici]KAI9618282.1 hypothetical protein KEM48_006827 [Puccinia striiformis f. sp. tritici PST-130]KNF05923.1 hypothetical protein PSTG_00916 [Puccinia striiformis f. sp. tritici PST-78]
MSQLIDSRDNQPLASNFSSPSSETSESNNTLQKIHSFSSITQLYFKFNKNRASLASSSSSSSHQPQKQQQHDDRQRLSSGNSVSSSYSNQSNQHYPNRLPTPSYARTASALPARLYIPNHQSFISPSQIQQKPASVASFDPHRPLRHQSSLPRFSQPKVQLRPRLNSASHSTTPLSISKKAHLIHPTQLNPLTEHQTYSQPSSKSLSLAMNHSVPKAEFLPHRSPSPSAASSTSHNSSTSSLPLSTSASSVSCSKAPASLPQKSSTHHLQSAPSAQPIHVIVRLRDQTKPNSGEIQPVSFDNESITLNIPVAMTNTNQQTNSYEFKVDKVIYPTPNAKMNVKVYERCSIEIKLLKPFLNGFNSSLIAYGQTGSGKSFTLGSDNDPSNTDGLIPKTLERLFANMELEKQDSQIELSVSFIEIYNDEIIDLLLNPPSVGHHDQPAKNQKKVPIKINEDKSDGTIELIGCKKLKISDLHQAMSYFNHGLAQRSIGATQMNQASSRSHAIFTVHLTSLSTSSTSSSNDSRNSHSIYKRTSSKFQFVDLAGSERINKTKNILGGDRFKEGIFINAGLHSLGNVISALSNQPSSLDSKNGNIKKKKNHIPYRESKLTRLMKDCLGGNSKTILISCISQNAQDLNESLNTLRYAIRAKKIENVSQKTTKVILTPSIPPMSRIASSKGKQVVSAGGLQSRIQTPTTRRLINTSSLSASSSIRTATSRAGTLVVGSGRREIKKPMVMMKHELSKIKALKAIVSKGGSSAQLGEGDPLCPAVYLANQVHKFFLLNSGRMQLNGPLARPIKLDAQLVNILQSHFALEQPFSPSQSLRGPMDLTSTALVPRPRTRVLSRPSNSLSNSVSSTSASHNSAQLALDDPFLLFLVDLNALFSNALSPTMSSTSTLPRPSLPLTRTRKSLRLTLV